jgi:phage gpG-like protein
MGITMVAKSTGNVGLKLQEMAARAKNPQAAWVNVGSYLAAVNRRQFATQGAYLNGVPWKPLKPYYLQWKVKSGYSKRILMQSGAMRLSFTSRPMAVEVYSGSSARFGSDHPLAKYHQYGTKRNGKRVNPKRQIVKVTPKVRGDVKTILANHITGKHTNVMSML